MRERAFDRAVGVAGVVVAADTGASGCLPCSPQGSRVHRTTRAPVNRPISAVLLPFLLVTIGFTVACESTTEEPDADAAADTSDADNAGGDPDTLPSADTGPDIPAAPDTEAPTVTGTVPTDGGCFAPGVREIYFQLSESPMPSSLFAPGTILVSATCPSPGAAQTALSRSVGQVAGRTAPTYRLFSHFRIPAPRHTHRPPPNSNGPGRPHWCQ